MKVCSNRSGRRWLLHEHLENRNLFAGDVASSPYQNPLEPLDLDGDGVVAPRDALVAINALNTSGAGQLAPRMAPPALQGKVTDAGTDYVDADGDGTLSPSDVLSVINRLNGGESSTPPSIDQHGDALDATATKLDVTSGFAKVCSGIETDGDKDVFQVTAATDHLSVALFARGDISVSVIDASGNVLSTANAKDAPPGRPAIVDLGVSTGTTYYVVVAGSNGATGKYGLQVISSQARDLKPITDAPLGTDVHGNTTSTATPLPLDRGHAGVQSNIDIAGDTDVMKVNAVAGKLLVFAGSKFGLKVEVTDTTGKSLASKDMTDLKPLEVNVVAGTYFVAVSAANGTGTGAYLLDVFNAPPPTPPPPPPTDTSGGTSTSTPTPEDVFKHLDVNADGWLSFLEFKAAPPPPGVTDPVDVVFAHLDIDRSGRLTLTEFKQGLPPPPPLG